MNAGRFVHALVAAIFDLVTFDLAETSAAAEPAATHDGPTLAFLQQHCLRSHGENKAAARCPASKLPKRGPP